MSAGGWHLARRVLAELDREVGLTDDDLAERLGVTVAELSPVIGMLYRQHRLTRCWGYACAIAAPADARPAGAETAGAA